MSDTVFVTGAAHGIGLASARVFAAAGHSVALGDIDIGAVERAAKTIPGSVPVKVDVTSRASVKEAFAAVEASLGPIDVLHANAGVSSMARAVEITNAEWERNFAVNARGVFLTNQEVARRLLREERAGVIVNIASLAAKVGAPLLAHYSASKFAVIGWTQALARELSPQGIRVYSVCPGFVATPMQDWEVAWEAELRGMTPDAVRKEYIAQTPLGRLETPEGVADVVVFLASSGARFMTGQAINVTGGVYMT